MRLPLPCAERRGRRPTLHPWSRSHRPPPAGL